MPISSRCHPQFTVFEIDQRSTPFIPAPSLRGYLSAPSRLPILAMPGVQASRLWTAHIEVCLSFFRFDEYEYNIYNEYINIIKVHILPAIRRLITVRKWNNMENFYVWLLVSSVLWFPFINLWFILLSLAINYARRIKVTKDNPKNQIAMRTQAL